jgi:hypothetical protein
MAPDATPSTVRRSLEQTAAAASAVPGGPTDQDAEDIARLFHFQRFAREDIGEQYPLAYNILCSTPDVFHVEL